MQIDKLIKAYLLNCKQNNLDLKTLKAYRIDLEQFYKFVANEDDFFSKDTINNYIHLLTTQNYAIKTIKRKIGSLKAFFSYLCYEDIIELNPFSKIKMRIKEPLILPKVIPVNDLQALFNHIIHELSECDSSTYKHKALIRDRAILELLIGTGIRISEVCSLKKENVMYENNIIKIYGKGAKERVIPIYSSTLIESLQKYEYVFSDELKESDFFFINKRKNGISSQSVRNMINRYCELAKINLHITPHMFRHTFATMLLDMDVDSRYIQILLGHSNIMTTQIYTHVSLNKKSEIMKYKNPRSKIGTNKG